MRNQTGLAEKKLNTTTSFFHWKRLVLSHHPKARFQIKDNGCDARLGQEFTCGAWDMIGRKGEVLHTPRRDREISYV